MVASLNISSQDILDWSLGNVTLANIKGYDSHQLTTLAHLGYFFLMQGKLTDAQVIFEGLAALDPLNDYYCRALGVIFHKLGDTAQSLLHFTDAIKINRCSPYSFVNRAEILLVLGNYPRAEEDLQSALTRMTGAHARLAEKAYSLLHVIRTTASLGCSPINA